MQFLVIVALCIALGPTGAIAARPIPAVYDRVGAMLCGVLFLSLLAALISAVTTHRLRGGRARAASASASHIDTALNGYYRLRFLHGGALVAIYAVVVYVLGWRELVWVNWGLARSVLVDDLLILAPFLLPVVIAWLCYYNVERALREHATSESAAAGGFWSRWDYLSFQIRHSLALVLAPVLVLLTAQDALDRWAPGAFDDLDKHVWPLAVLFSVLAATVVLYPLLIRWLWHAKPLPAGPLRARLETLSRRAGFRASDILVWDTRRGVANAAVAGIIPQVRYVLLSDALLHHLSDDEVEAVFGHEVGHIKHHHLAYYVLFAALGMLLFHQLAPLADRWSDLLADTAPVLRRQQALAGWTTGLLWVAGYIGLVFGFLSRRFERQADVFGCRAISCAQPTCPPHHAPLGGTAGSSTSGYTEPADTNRSPTRALSGSSASSIIVSADTVGVSACASSATAALPAPTAVHLANSAIPPKLSAADSICPVAILTFIHSLDKIALLNGIGRNVPAWRHFSIARRIRFLERIADNPALERRFQRAVRILKSLLLLTLAALGASLLRTSAWLPG